MKVRDLVKSLNSVSLDILDYDVMMASDSECNNIYPLTSADITEGILIEGEFYDPEWSADEADMDPEEWERVKKNSPRCIVFIP